MPDANQNDRSMMLPPSKRSLSHRTARAGIWASSSRIIAKVFQLASGVVLARLLAPQDFGLISIAVTASALVQGLTSFGLNSALIQRREVPAEYLNTAWTFGLLRGVILATLLYVFAPAVGEFFHEPRAIIILRVIGLSCALMGLQNIGIVLLRKDLSFARLFVLDVGGGLAYVALAVPLALVLRNAWALVGALLGKQLIECVLSYCVHAYRPRLAFNPAKAKELFKFGKWILGGEIVRTAQRTGINIFVGRILGVPQLGFYSRAEAFSKGIFDELLGGVISRVVYPMYSALQERPSQLRQAYIRTLELLSFGGMPIVGGIFVLGTDFTRLFLTDRWMPIVPVMRILCLLALLAFVSAPGGILFQAVGKPSIGTKISGVSLLLLAGFIYPAVSLWGLPGVAGAMFASVFLTTPVAVYLAIRIAGCRARAFFMAVLPPLACTILMVLTVWGIRTFAMQEVRGLEFSLLILSGCAAYFLFSLILVCSCRWGIFRSLRQVVISLRE